MDDTINRSTTTSAMKTNGKKRQTRKTINKGDRRPTTSKRNKTKNIPMSNFPCSTSVLSITATEDNDRHPDNPVADKIADEPVATTSTYRHRFDPTRDAADAATDAAAAAAAAAASAGGRREDDTKTNFIVDDELQKNSSGTKTINTDDSENSSEEKGTGRKERKPLPLTFDRFRSADNDRDNDSSSETSEDVCCKGTGSAGKCCVYLGERETLRSFWDKCLYQCFKSKRCVAGEKPKRKYRKKTKTSKIPTKKRKSLDPPLSCIDTKGTAAVVHKDYLSRYETLLFVDPLADTMTPWEKKDFEMVFRMVKPADIFALKTRDNVDDDADDDGESTDYTNSDTDQEV